VEIWGGLGRGMSGFFSGMVRGVWIPPCPLQSIPFLCQTRWSARSPLG
jgi:hypothetical protein